MNAPFLKKLSLAAASVVATLCCVEIGLRVWKALGTNHPNPPIQTAAKIHDYFFCDAQGCFRIVPNSAGLHLPYEGRTPVTVTINSQGFRGPEPQTNSRTRIVFLGDSIVFDGGVPDEKTFVRLTEMRLNLSLPERNRPAECFNFGTTDAGVVQYVAKVQYHALPLCPNIVVIGFYLNDARPPQGFLGEKRYSALENRLVQSPFYHLLLVRMFHERYRVAKVSQNQEFQTRFAWVDRFNSGTWVNRQDECDRMIDEARYDWGAAWVADTWPLVEPHLKSIARLCRQSNAVPVLVCFPASPQVQSAELYPRLHWPQEKLTKFSADLGLPFLDLLPALRNHRQDNLFADQCHLTSRGNQIVAEALAPWLEGIILREPAEKTPQPD